MTTDETHTSGRVRQLRLVVEAEDFDDAVEFYRDALGLSEQSAFQGDGDAQVAILHAGRATLEITNPGQRRMIDAVEAGGRRSERIRVAFEVDDTAALTEELLSAGAALLAEPVVTPWQSLNSRLAAPAGLQITLFEELQERSERSTEDGAGTSGERAAADVAPPALEHLALSVRDLQTSTRWYETLFGAPPVFVGTMLGGTEHEHQVAVWATPNLGLHCFEQQAGGDFTPRRPGLDHVAFHCADERELQRWSDRLDQLGIERSEILTEPYGSGLAFTDPDGIALELFASAR